MSHLYSTWQQHSCLSRVRWCTSKISKKSQPRQLFSPWQMHQGKEVFSSCGLEIPQDFAHTCLYIVPLSIMSRIWEVISPHVIVPFFKRSIISSCKKCSLQRYGWYNLCRLVNFSNIVKFIRTLWKTNQIAFYLVFSKSNHRPWSKSVSHTRIDYVDHW